MFARTRSSTRARTEGGYVAALAALFVSFLMVPLCALSVDVARWYVEVQRVQNAADAAATAGVTFLPDDFAAAESTAMSVAARNGYAHGGKFAVSVAIGDKPTQLRVTISSTVGNPFGAALGLDVSTIVRSATADYNGPAPMGSPCNAFGNEPPGSGNSVRGPVGSVISAPPGGAVCTSSPQFWSAVAGPDTPKGNGDQYMTRTCNAGNDGCTGTTNDEFDPRGHFYVIRVNAAAVGTPVTVQLFDPAWVETGDNCEAATSVTTTPSIPLRNNMNLYTADGIARYAKTAGTYCPGDVLNGGTDPITTSYVLREPTDTYIPSNGAPITSCVKQYNGYLKADNTTGTLADKLPGSDTSQPGTTDNSLYKAEVAKVFHQWLDFCTFTPDRTGDYYLQVRTNVALGGISDGEGGYNGNANVYAQAGDNNNVHGSGNNRFAVRLKGPGAGAVAVSGWQHMTIYANYSGAQTEFNLVRVIPAAATKTLLVAFYDVGDASNPGTITVLPPTDSNMSSTINDCVANGVVDGALPGCQFLNVSSASGWNGKIQYVRIPIPNTYTCNASQAGGCWFRLQVSFPGGVNDTTTWTGQITGDPIRLIK